MIKTCFLDFAFLVKVINFKFNIHMYFISVISEKTVLSVFVVVY